MKNDYLRGCDAGFHSQCTGANDVTVIAIRSFFSEDLTESAFPELTLTTLMPDADSQ